MDGRYNTRNPAVKRLMREAQELAKPTEEYSAQPLEENLFEWHFTVRGPPETEFDGGVYHGRIILPPEYPMKPPNIIILTPNGRFEINKKICLSISGFHPEAWQPSWSIRTALLAIIGFMPTPARGTIGSLDYTPKERKILARKSQDFECYCCGKISSLLAEQTGTSKSISEEVWQLALQISMKGEDGKKASKDESAVSNQDSVGSETPVSEQRNEGPKVGEDNGKKQLRDSTGPGASWITAGMETDARRRVVEMQIGSQSSQTTVPSVPTPGLGTHIIAQNYNNSASSLCQGQISNIVICLLVLAITGLLCRRLFLLE